MLEGFKKIDNPLTVIGIFAGVSEISMGAVAALSPELRPMFLWFVVLFPPFLISLFFITLNFNHKVLYAPSDYRDDSTFAELAKAPTENAKKELDSALEKLKAAKATISTSNLETEGKSKAANESLSKVLKEITESVTDARESVESISFDDSSYPDMTWGQWRIFAYLSSRNKPVLDTEIVRALKLSSKTFHRNIAYLRLERLVTRETRDGRPYFTVTPEGKRWAEKEMLKYIPVARHIQALEASDQTKS